jgi:acyl-[acyl-carrier-protein]-phospholipid O-acyltransferase/long-chain-fatty-acid--[acyl-carrier-protein] ligase
MVQQQYVTPLAAILTIGIGIGALLCGYISGKRIELGLVSVGAFFMGLFILVLGFTPGYAETIGKGMGSPLGTPYIFGAIFMFLAGLGAGLYDIPLAAYIQKNSPPEKRGRMIAAYNFCTFSAMFVFAGLGLLGAILFSKLGWSAGGASLMIWMATGLVTLAVSAVLLYVYAAPFLIFFFRHATRIVYRPKFVGTENVPAEGPALLVCNHISLLDGFFLYFACPRNIRYIAHEAMIPKMFECCVRETRLIKILPGSPKNVIKAIRDAREALQHGEVVAVFAEGGITRNGQMKAFEPGFMSILKGVTTPDGKPVPVIPCHIGGLHESMFGYKYDDKKMTLRPRKLLTDVIISFGKPMTDVKYPLQVQLAVQELGVDSLRDYNTKKLPIPVRQLVQVCKRRKNKLLFADSTGIELSGYKFLTAALALRSLLREHVLASRSEEPHVGILAPMSVGGCLLNTACNLDRRVPVNLNFTFGAEGMNYCIRQAGIKNILTSRKVLERFPHLKTELEATLFCTEDLLKQLSPVKKILYFLAALLLPSGLIEWKLGLRTKGISEELMSIIYTSGSTGQPKGVMLTNDNIAEVARGFVGAMRLNEKDTLLGFLPFFHAFGLMGNFWLTIFSGGQGVFHFSPLEPKKVGEMARKYPVTFMPSTPTFLRNFLRACPKEDFENLPGIMCGAEKLPLDLIDAWHEKYGVRPGEGFGATELSPVMATNVPESRTSDTFHRYRKDGSIGRTLCNVAVKVIDLETGVDMPPNEIGMIVAKGPTVMKGYYQQPDKTAEVIKDGWYSTGDVGKIDVAGFIWVTGRESRISKIGGEMVPHILIEEEITKILEHGKQADTESNEPTVAVTALPHPTRGEQIIVLYRNTHVNPTETVEQMIAADLPRLWIPHVDGFINVDSIPTLGTGKLDLAAIKRIAAEKHKEG